MTKIANYDVPGKSGTKYRFSMYKYPDDLESASAVYILTHRNVDAEGKGKHTNIYVGQTSNLSERHEDHHKEECFQRRSANCIGILIEGDERRRLAIEADIRNNGFNWLCND